METWSFDWEPSDPVPASNSALAHESVRSPLILRRRPAAVASHDFLPEPFSLQIEAELLRAAKAADVSVPDVIANTSPDTELGEALVLSRIDGEALPQRLMRDPRYTDARERLAYQCGEALARIHSISIHELPTGLRDLSWSADIDRLQALCDLFGNPSPVHQLALNWLRTQSAPKSARVLCHGDFRLGNLLVDEQGLSAVLDWELAHLGHAGEDLGYLCANVWRFGGSKPVAGVGDYKELLDGYARAGGEPPDTDELVLWQVYAALGWGIVCLTMLELHLSGIDPGLERAAVGRRLSESEMDLLLLLEEVGA